MFEEPNKSKILVYNLKYSNLLSICKDRMYSSYRVSHKKGNPFYQ